LGDEDVVGYVGLFVLGEEVGECLTEDYRGTGGLGIGSGGYSEIGFVYTCALAHYHLLALLVSTPLLYAAHSLGR